MKSEYDLKKSSIRYRRKQTALRLYNQFVREVGWNIHSFCEDDECQIEHDISNTFLSFYSYNFPEEKAKMTIHFNRVLSARVGEVIVVGYPCPTSVVFYDVGKRAWWELVGFKGNEIQYFKTARQVIKETA